MNSTDPTGIEIEIEIDDPTLHILTQVIKATLGDFCDPHSMGLFNDERITTLEELKIAIGTTMVNATIVSVLEEAIKKHPTPMTPAI